MRSIGYLFAMSVAVVWQEGARAQSAEEATVAAEKQEIVVTAQRRKEDAMTTPISISVLSGDDLAVRGVSQIDGLQFVSPSLVINYFGQGTNFNIRGVGKAEQNPQTGTGVVIYRDGVPTFPGYIQSEPFYDVDTIQILRGPQGSIIGQNSTGGAVFINTKEPKVGGKPEGFIAANFGSYRDLGLQAAINLPLTKTLAARIAVFGERRDGFYKITGPNGRPYVGNNGDRRFLAGRLSLLWQPNAQLSVLSKTDLDYLDLGAHPASPYTNQFRFLPFGSNTPNPNYRDLFDITANAPQVAREKFIRTILKVEYSFDSGTRLRSISSFQSGNSAYQADLDGTATANSILANNVSETQITQEVNLISSNERRLDWQVGGLAVWNTYHFLEPYQFVIGVPPGNPATEYRLQGRNPTTSFAAFGQMGYRLTPSLKIELGLRYTASQTINTIDVIQFGFPIQAYQGTFSQDISYKASLGWQPTPAHYVYALVATGYRPGGLNLPVGFGLLAPFAPEKIVSYEAGWKGSFADGRITANVSGFLYNYRNFQVVIGFPNFPVFPIELNVPTGTRIYGIEAELNANLGRFQFNLGINALNSRLGQFFATDPRLGGLATCDGRTGPASASCIDLTNRRQTYAPNVTFNAGGQYQFVLGNADKITARADFGHVGSQWATLFENPALGDFLEARNIVNAQLSWSRGSVTMSVYGTNLTDQHYPGALNNGLYFAGPPREYGIRIHKAF